MTRELQQNRELHGSGATDGRHALLESLDHLIYVIECLASDIPGEAKTELSRLIEALEGSKLSVSERVLAELQESQKFLREAQYRAAVSPLSRARAAFWKELEKHVVPSA